MCPSCYEGSIRKGEPVYDPLIFAFDSVSSCPCHSGPLSEMCPGCKSQLPCLLPDPGPATAPSVESGLGVLQLKENT
jgi:hypothetical protein